MYINLGRTGQLKIWLDGKECSGGRDLHSWTSGDSEVIILTGTGKPQRLVVKLVNPTDEAVLSLHLMHHEMSINKQGVSYLIDSLADQVPDIGYDL